jgi:hypothetical protein
MSIPNDEAVADTPSLSSEEGKVLSLNTREIVRMMDRSKEGND